MPTRVQVRPLQQRDEARWRAMFEAYIAFYQASVADDVIKLTWQRLTGTGEGNQIGLVASDDADVPIGIAHILFHRSTWSATWYCYLEDLFVDPGARGRGVGRALIEATYREADVRGATRTYWATQESNATARALYDKLASRSAFVQYRR